jgi:hypothetical protein
MIKAQRPRTDETEAAVGDGSRQDHPTTSPHPASAPTELEAAGPVGRYRLADAVPIRDRLIWDLRDIASLTGLSVRLLYQERAAGRMPHPDIRVGRRCLYRPATISAWLDSLATGQGRSR